MLKKSVLALATSAVVALPAAASTAISGGFWLNHTFNVDNDQHEVTYGDTDFEALILYLDHEDEKTGWKFSGEMRYGKGAFTDPANNNTGSHFGLHKAWVGKQFESGFLKVGKTQVPFSWATVNFWPGDGLLGGYGDQMDVGVKWSANADAISYDVAYFAGDDFGDSTETMDDDMHWGSKSTYRKTQTFVGNVALHLSETQKLGISYQNGKLKDLAGNTDRPLEGDHNATALYYEGAYGDLGIKAQYVFTERNLDGLASAPAGVEKIKNDRRGLTMTYAMNDVTLFVDYTSAEAKTKGNKIGTAEALAPGVSYNYGPGWVYLEYVNSDGDISRDGMVTNGDYEAWFATIDYYF